jgi:hypothetical protein
MAQIFLSQYIQSEHSVRPVIILLNPVSHLTGSYFKYPREILLELQP